MKTIKLTKAIIAICILCFTLAGTTSCKKEANEAIAPQKVIDQKLVGTWSHTITVINGNGIQDFTEETFNVPNTWIFEMILKVKLNGQNITIPSMFNEKDKIKVVRFT